MNNKSTENLIESGGSIEEIFVPPLDLTNKKQSIVTDKIDSENGPKIQNRRRAPNNFLVEKTSIEESESKSRIPVPAVRKYSLPPVASERNGDKDLKENSNQQTRKRSVQTDTVQILSEKPNHRKSEKNDSRSGSDSDSQQAESAHLKDRKKIELSTFSKERKKHLRKPFVSAEVNEETTSFISYEEKHEKEDNSEHLTSIHSSETNKNQRDNNDDGNSGGGIRNNAFIQDSDDDVDKNHAKIESANDLNEEHVKPKSTKREKKPKSGKISKEKRKKRPSRTAEHTEKPTESAEHDEIQEVYDFKKVIGKE